MTNEAPLIRKLDELQARFQSLQDSLNDPAVLTNPQRLVPITRESGQLDPIVRRYREYNDAKLAYEQTRELAGNKADAEMAELARSELPQAQSKMFELLESLK